MKDNAPFLDMPNGMVTPNCHNNVTIKVANPNKAGPTNAAAKVTPKEQVMNETMHARK